RPGVLRPRAVRARGRGVARGHPGGRVRARLPLAARAGAQAQAAARGYGPRALGEPVGGRLGTDRAEVLPGGRDGAEGLQPAAARRPRRGYGEVLRDSGRAAGTLPLAVSQPQTHHAPNAKANGSTMAKLRTEMMRAFSSWFSSFFFAWCLARASAERC